MTRRITLSLAFAAATMLCAAHAASAQDAASLYLKNCKNCHGPAGGEPSPAMKARLNPPKLFDAGFLARTNDQKFMDSMVKGGEKMKPLADKMSQPEMKAVIKYIRDYVKTENGGK